ncbi:hypothetical protein EYC80_005249 [Monilinia laxa]|uniref:Transmembrane protein n=1 Tax=Monilinia laxa TaxID=61186 RepID=A0A5N6KJB6_MONLA|nr:hypothetical protein EYC80_005249 [Monilinia laxa]
MKSFALDFAPKNDKKIFYRQHLFTGCHGLFRKNLRKCGGVDSKSGPRDVLVKELWLVGWLVGGWVGLCIRILLHGDPLGGEDFWWFGLFARVFNMCFCAFVIFYLLVWTFCS